MSEQPRLNYEVCGSGQGLVLLHPLGYDRRFWSELVPHVQASYRCVVVDQRGWGGSKPIQGRGDRVADLKSVLAETGSQEVAIIAVGTAGDIALSLASDEHTGVVATLLINPAIREWLHPDSPSYIGPMVDRDRADSLRQIAGGGGVDALLDGIDKSGTRPRWRVTHREMLANLETRTEPTQTYEPIYLDRTLESISIPVQIMVVSEEPKGSATLEEVVRRLASTLPNSEVVRVVSLWSQLIPLADPATVASRIRSFLGSDSYGT